MTGQVAGAAAAVEGVIALVVLLIVLYVPAQRLCVNYARDVIFEQREAVFDLAAHGRLIFGSDTYVAVRDEMNGMIRLAHKLTVWRLILLRVTMLRSEGWLQKQTIDSVVAQIADRQTRDEVATRMRTARAAMLMMVMTRSLIWLAAFIVAIALWRLIVFVARDQADALRGLRARAERWLVAPLEEAVREEKWMASVAPG